MAGMRLHVTQSKLKAKAANPGVPDRAILMNDIEGVVVGVDCNISTPALRACALRGIPVYFMGNTGNVLSIARPPVMNAEARLAQYERKRDPEFAVAVARKLVEAKIRNSRRILQRLQANASDRDATGAIRRLGELVAQVTEAGTLDRLRGLEGGAAGIYFEAYGSFYPPTAPFNNRSRRPPLNAPNAVLSYAYTLLGGDCLNVCLAIGLEPAIGCLHESDAQRPSLVLDLIEPFRAAVADALALDMFSHGRLHPTEHFDPIGGGIHLNTEGKRRLFVAYETRMERPFTHPGRSERSCLRREIELQARAYKAHVLTGAPFNPYTING